MWEGSGGFGRGIVGREVVRLCPLTVSKQNPASVIFQTSAG
jgi:hypothetical protein